MFRETTPCPECGAPRFDSTCDECGHDTAASPNPEANCADCGETECCCTETAFFEEDAPCAAWA